jgi:predicted lysophospholipase L1 biosynthesis ABC-type transport system permease subunit
MRMATRMHPRMSNGEYMFSDLRLALRQLRRSPGFALTAILTLALGIGANAAIFTLVDFILLRPLPFPQQDRLVQIGSTCPTRLLFIPKDGLPPWGSTPPRSSPSAASARIPNRTSAIAMQAASELRRTVAGINAQVPVTRVRTLDEVVSASESAPRALTVLLLAFGALALMIGGVGVYSLIAFVVSSYTREFGIRLALGAQRWQILGGVVRQGLLLAFAGSLVGLIAAAMVAQAMRAFLFEVRSIDPLTFCVVPLLMTLLVLAAVWVPARRAANVDPMRTLRE